MNARKITWKTIAAAGLMASAVAITACSDFLANAEDINPSNVSLKGISLSDGNLSPAFAEGTTAYTVGVAYAVSSVLVTGSQSDNNATMTGPVTLSGLAVGSPQTATITVAAPSGLTRTYTVEVTRVANTAKAISAFSFANPAATGTVTESTHAIAVAGPFGTTVTALVPTITHTGASINPATGVAHDFTSPVTYTVTAADGTTQEYVVTVAVTDAAVVAAAKAALVIQFPAGDSAGRVTGDLTLPTSEQGATIVWSSPNPAVVSTAGVVTRPVFDAGSTTVSLVATITAGSETRTKAFSITVLPLKPTDAQAIGADASALAVGLGGNTLASFVTQDIDLPLSGIWGTTISWTGDKPGIISDAGVVHSALTDQVVTMTATISRGDGTSVTKDFTCTVKATGAAAVTIGLPATPAAADLVFRDSGNAQITAFIVERGSTVIVNTSFVGTYAWYVDSASSSISAASTCQLAWNVYPLGFYTLMIDADSGGKYRSAQILFKVDTP